jgi:hypothetical protein
MTTTDRTRRPKVRRIALAGGLSGAVVLAMLIPAQGSSHREAPLIAEDPAADNTDVYAFVSPDDPDSVTLISNFTGFQEPGGGPNYFKFGDDVLYEIHVDNDGDAVEDITYEFRFSTTTVNPDTYLYANNAPIESIESDAWNRPQTYTVTKVEDGQRSVVGSDLLTPPNNVGPRSTPDYESLAAEAVHDLGSGQVFAGQRDEGFYIDIASIFDLGTLRPFQQLHAVEGDSAGSNEAAEGIDTFAGYNVNSIALEIPTDELTYGDEDVIGVWSTASRRKVRVFSQNSSANPVDRGRWVQVSRLGHPLINELVVPLRFKDVFNTLQPQQDATVFPTLEAPDAVGDGVGATNGDIPLVTDPILAEQIAALYGIEVPCTSGDSDADQQDCEDGRTELTSVFLTGLEDLNQPANVVPAEMLRLNTSIAPSDDPDRLGVVGGDTAGFPNGRRVGDDVVDISLKVVAGVLRDDAPPEAEQLTDGVTGNDRDYLDGFPYLGTPHEGYELDNPARVTNP